MRDELESVLASFSLNAERLEIAGAVDRNALVLAGPGAGKTHLLVAHAVALATVAEGRAVLLTFSRKAAAEIQRRIDGALPPALRGRVVASTIHAHALDLVRAHGHRVGVVGKVEVLEERDLQVLADEVARANRIEEMESFAESFSRYQRLAGDFLAPGLPPLFKLVDHEMRIRGKSDWDGCIRLATELLSTVPEVRRSVRHHDRSLLVDEAQDCDAGQLAFLEQLVGEPPGQGHLFVVMDPDQSLYGFRQANAEAVRAWAAQYVSEPVEVSENYRCAPRIQALARYVLGKPWLGALEPGVAIMQVYQDAAEEARGVASAIAERVAARISLDRIAVLGRRRSRLEPVRDALSGVLALRADGREHWTGVETRVLELGALVKAWREGAELEGGPSLLARATGVSRAEALAIEREALRGGLHVGDVLSSDWWVSLKAWVDEKRRSPHEIVVRLGQVVGLSGDELAELEAAAIPAKNLADFLTRARGGPSGWRSQERSGLLVATFHGAKGLEFDAVFIVGCEDGTIPDFRSRDQAALRDDRRALYVAITRAAKEVVLTRVRSQNGYTKATSRFLPPPSGKEWSA